MMMIILNIYFIYSNTPTKIFRQLIEIVHTPFTTFESQIKGNQRKMNAKYRKEFVNASNGHTQYKAIFFFVFVHFTVN